MTSSSRLLTKGPRIGRCNICGDYGPLTEDHTPPKGCVHPTQVEMQHITAALSQEPSQTRGAYSQNGVKYRTLCGVCNNTRLGARYDPHLISFVNAIGQVLRSQIYLPNSLTLNVRPQPVVRAILGHMAAQGVDRYEKGPLTAEFRSYLLDETLPIPGGIGVYYWAHPHRRHVMVRDAGLIDFKSGISYAFWLLKFFPVAFLVTWGEAATFPYPVSSFQPWREVPFEFEAEIPLVLRPRPPMKWPESPTDDTGLLYGREAMHVTAHRVASRREI